MQDIGSERMLEKTKPCIAKRVYCELCKKNWLEHMDRWYEQQHVPERAVENEEVEVL